MPAAPPRSTPAPRRTARALSFSALALTCLLVLVSLEGAVRLLYHAPAPMLDKARSYEAAAHGGRELLILGTCLPEQIIQPALLGELLGGDVRVHNLATPAGTARLWLLFMRHHLPADAQVAAIVVPFGQRDLTKLMAPWESQAMQLATWRDLPDLVRWGCEDVGCGLELVLRKASHAYRYRGYLANAFWQGLGSHAPIPGSLLSPGAVAPTDRGTANAPPTGQGQPMPRDPQVPPPRHPGPAADERGAPGAQLGWETGPAPTSETDPSRFVYLREFLALARQRGIPVVLTPLPTRSRFQGHAPPQDPTYQRLLRETIAAGGGRTLDLAAVPGLSARHFIDDVHLDPEGQRLVTRHLGQVLSSALLP